VDCKQFYCDSVFFVQFAFYLTAIFLLHEDHLDQLNYLSACSVQQLPTEVTATR